MYLLNEIHSNSSYLPICDSETILLLIIMNMMKKYLQNI